MRMHQTMRWYGTQDTVKLSHIRQAGCAGVVTALHHIPVGDTWTVEEIEKRRKLIEDAGMTWTVVESLPVSDDIKRQSNDWKQHIENYETSLRNVAACGLKVITYNFMPVFDWLRTDVNYKMPDGSKALYFNRSDFAVFDLFMLKRPGAEKDYDAATIEKARIRMITMTDADKEKLFRNCLLGLPGSDTGFTPDQVIAELKKYEGIDEVTLKQNLFYFLKQVIPIAEECGLLMAIHPDDPPYPVLGLPRIMSTENDAAEMINAVSSKANGLCFCTGSFGARVDNDISAMLKRFGDHIHFLHLRNIRKDGEGNFYESAHLDGDIDMYDVIKEIVQLQKHRSISLPVRPDHGLQILDDLEKKTYPGYSAIGRLKGLAELRGVEYAILKGMQ